MLFRDDIIRWESQMDLILTMDKEAQGYTGNVGLVTKFIPELKLKDIETAQAVVVGPPAMMKFSVIELLKLGFKEENIWVSYERKMCCGIGKCGHCKVNDTYICLDGPVFNYVDSKALID
jgi:anaerobic sulfite reductase, subunit B